MCVVKTKVKPQRYNMVALGKNVENASVSSYSGILRLWNTILAN